MLEEKGARVWSLLLPCRFFHLGVFGFVRLRRLKGSSLSFARSTFLLVEKFRALEAVYIIGSFVLFFRLAWLVSGLAMHRTARHEGIGNPWGSTTVKACCAIFSGGEFGQIGDFISSYNSTWNLAVLL